jgi:hypothetical protein
VKENWIRRFLYFVGAWNVLGGLIALADPSRHFAQLYKTSLSLNDPLQLFFFRATWINVIAWGIGYILAARYPSGRTPILLAGATGKMVYFVACLALYLSGTGGVTLLVFGIFDVIFAALFFFAVQMQKNKTQSVQSTRQK